MRHRDLAHKRYSASQRDLLCVFYPSRGKHSRHISVFTGNGWVISVGGALETELQRRDQGIMLPRSRRAPLLALAPLLLAASVARVAECSLGAATAVTGPPAIDSVSARMSTSLCAKHPNWPSPRPNVRLCGKRLGTWAEPEPPCHATCVIGERLYRYCWS